MKSGDKTISQLLLALDQVSDAIIIVSPAQQTIQVNKQFLHFFPGIDKQDLLNKPVSVLIEHLSYSIEHKNNVSADALKRYIATRLRNKARDKSCLEFEFKNDDGRHLRYQDQITDEGFRIGVFKDESSILALHQQFENACDEAEKLSHAKNSFMAAMSHEVKTPLNAIIGMLDLCVLDDYIGSNEYIKRIQANADNLLSLINNVLDFAKFDANKVVLSEVDTNLRVLAETVIDSFAGSARTSNTQLHLFVDPNIPSTMLLDDLRITQVLNNLISNGLKFNTSKHPKLSLSMTYSHTKNQVVCEVSDNGIGISHEQQKYVFAGFEQASTDTHRRFGGSGLGLSICQRISWLMRGSLSVSSELSKGTTFTFVFPVPPHDTLQDAVLPELKHLTLSSNDPGFFKGLSYYKSFYKFKTKFYATPPDTLNNNEFLFLACAANNEANSAEYIKNILRSQHAGQLSVLANFDEELALAAKELNVRTVSSTPLRINEILRIITNENELESKPLVSPAIDNETDAFFFDDITALVVEDNPDNMFVFQRQLQKLSVSADFALDPQEAIIHFEQKHYDIVLSDFQMPGLSGAQLVEQLRRIERKEQRKQALMFVITADKTDLCKTECLQAGCNEVLMKPLTIAMLADLFQTVSNIPSSLQTISPDTQDQKEVFNLSVLDDILGEVSKEELDEFLTQYEINLNSAIAQIVECALAADWTTLATLAHSLKSSTLIIGASALSNCCSELELVCAQSDSQKIEMTWQKTQKQIVILQEALSGRES